MTSRTCVRAVAFAWVLTATTMKSASAADPAAAETLFTEAKALIAQGKYAEACPKLEESQRLDAGIGTLFNLGDCYEHIGRTASAWAAFLEVGALAKTANQKTREADARGRAAQLEPKLSKLVVAPSPAAANLSAIVVKRDATEVGRAQWGSQVPVDPGKHVVVASAPGKKTWQSEVVVAAPGAVTVTIPALEDAPEPPPSVVVAPRERSRAVRAHASTNQGAVQRGIGFILGGVGLAGLGVGSYFGLSSIAKHSDAAPHCDASSTCDETGVALRHGAREHGNVSTVAFATGGAFLITGAIVLLTAPRGASSADDARTSRSRTPLFGVDAGVAGVSMRGRF